jgi:site-specific recombinase XerD
MPKAPVKLFEPLSPQEIDIITGIINKPTPQGQRDYAIFAIMLDSGPRLSEVVGISLDNLNLSQGSIQIMGKGWKERSIPIGRFVTSLLYHYIDYERPKLNVKESNYLFLSQDGNPVTANALKLMFSRLAKKSRVTRLHAHLCRHTFAINYLLNGGDVFSLKEILGHTTLEMVNHYLHFTRAQISDQHRKYSPMDKFYLTHEDRNQ